jgi:hypothetical protein
MTTTTTTTTTTTAPILQANFDHIKQQQQQYQPVETLLVKCCTLVSLINDVQKILKSDNERVIPMIYTQLAGPLCKLTKTIEPNAGKKMDEIIYVYEHMNSVTGKNLHVNDKQHGADILDDNGNVMELKVAICKTKGKANFNWELPSTKSLKEDEKREKLLKSVEEKTKGIGCMLVVKNGVQETLQQYELSHDFMMGYFKRIKFGKSNVHNMGCVKCKTCSHFHRVQKMEMYSNYMKTIENKDLSETQWEHVLSKTKSDCKGTNLELIS